GRTTALISFRPMISSTWKNCLAAIEERLLLCESLGIGEKVKGELKINPFASKLDQVLKKNLGFGIMDNI
ncbi:Hypothetical protein FKW44_011283, partial [Caligus rogercresseyi]